MPETLENQPIADLKSIGEVLKAKREELSYTIEHVAEITRITLSNLRAIEEGDLEHLPGLVFVRGFVRNYANLLGLEADWMIETLNQAYSGQGAVNRAPGEDVLDDEYAANRNANILKLIGLVIIIFIAVGVWAFSSTSQPTAPIETIQAVVKKEEPKTAEQTAAPVTPAISPLNLVIVGQLEDWVNLKVDSGETKEFKLTKGKKYEFPAQEVYDIVMTSGASASIYLNGEEILIDSAKKEDLYQAKLNKFSLTKLNN